MKEVLALLVLGVVLVSGCISTGTVASGSGVVIEAFEPDFSDVYSGENVQLRLLIRNTGSTDAKDINVEFTLPDGKSEKAASSFILLPADSERGIQGETKTITEPFKAPTLPDKISIVYYPSVRVTYGYTTTTVKSLAVGSIEEFRRLQDTGGTVPAETLSSTNGPISINVVTKGPIRVSKDGFTFPIEIVVSNVGGGVVCPSSSCSKDEWNKLKIKIKTDDPFSISSECGNKKEITLFRGKTTTIGCKVTSSKPSTGPIQGLITVKAENYGYFTDATTQLRVTGVETKS